MRTHTAQESRVRWRRVREAAQHGHPNTARPLGYFRKHVALGCGHPCLFCRWKKLYGPPPQRQRRADLTLREALMDLDEPTRDA